MHGKLRILIAAAVVLTALAGCYESPGTKLHKPGVYNGPKDPLLAKQRDPQQQTALRERFDMVQRDR
jgi:hypothetical protein